MDNKSPDAFRTISEVADWLGVPAHVLRFWESRFGQVKPVKRAGGRRYYRPSDMELLGGIRKLLHEDGLTIRGVQKLLRENGVKYVAAMSPPIDQPADLKDVSASSKAPRELEVAPHDTRHDTQGDHDTGSERAAPIFDPGAEEAVEVAPTPEPPHEPTREPAQELAQELVSSPTANTPQRPEPRVPGDQGAAPQVGADLAETVATADPVDTADTGATAPEGVEPEDVEPEDVEPQDTVAASPPFDSPEAIDFYAHEAQPETGEYAAPPREPSASQTVVPEQETDIEAPQADVAGASQGSSAPGTDGDVAAHASPPELAPEMAPETPPETDASSAAPKSPDPVPVEARAETPEIDATHPEPREQTPEMFPGQARVIAQEDMPQAPAPAVPPAARDNDAAGADSADTISANGDSLDSDKPTPGDTDDTAPTQSPESRVAPDHATATTPDVVMPTIGADPDDDDVISTTPAVAAALRRHRFRAIVGPPGADLDPALLKAQVDRLQALSGRLGAAPDGRRAF